MKVRDSQVNRLIERIGDHYKSNISNRFIRPALLQITLKNQTWDLLETFAEKNIQYQYQGYDLADLYRQVAAAARFVNLARRELVPSLRNRLSTAGTGNSDRVMRDMAINNFASNLQVFADLIIEMYDYLIDLDKANSKNKNPEYLSIPELHDVAGLLAK
jgi:hypothetical protein